MHLVKMKSFDVVDRSAGIFRAMWAGSGGDIPGEGDPPVFDETLTYCQADGSGVMLGAFSGVACRF
ncbi:MAG: hypothetical protein AB9891_16760 [Anaerolineaceae bacterium]